MQITKIFVTGPLLAGKSTFIQTISELEIRPVHHSRQPENITPATAVYSDFGRIMADDDTALYLYGDVVFGPYAGMWEMILDKALGSIIILDGSRPDTFDEVIAIGEKLWAHSQLPIVVAANRATEFSRDSLAHRLNVDTEKIFLCDNHNRNAVKLVVLSLLHQHLPNLMIEKLISKVTTL